MSSQVELNPFTGFLIPKTAKPAPGTAASPGFQYGRFGTVTSGTYLQVVGGNPSNTTGIPVPFAGFLTRIAVINKASNTFDITVERRDTGPTFVTLKTVSIVALRKDTFDVTGDTIAVSDGDEIVVKQSSGTSENVAVYLVFEQ